MLPQIRQMHLGPLNFPVTSVIYEKISLDCIVSNDMGGLFWFLQYWSLKIGPYVLARQALSTWSHAPNPLMFLMDDIYISLALE
jgi:hypothetical protein